MVVYRKQQQLAGLDYHCLKNGVPPSDEWVREVDAYERRVLSRR